jgi:gamma-glutamylputrescine oxidase
VVGLDAGAVGGGAAGRNGGFFLGGLAEFHHQAVARWGVERATAAYRATLVELDRMTAETPSVIRRVGSLRLAVDEAELADCTVQHTAMAAADLAADSYEGPEGRGLLFPLDGAGNPLDRCRLLAAAALRSGALLFEHSPAVAITGTRVVTGQGAIDCDRVVVAVDGGLERLLPELAGRVRTTRLQMLATAPDRSVSIPRPVYARYGFDYWQQLPDGRVTAGGLRDRFEAAEWDQGTVPTDELQRALEAMLRDRTKAQAPVTHRWAGAVAFTPDHLPIAEELRPGVMVIGAYSGTGNVIGSLLGRAAADWTITGSLTLPW